MRTYLFKLDESTEEVKFMKANICMHISLGFTVMEKVIVEDSFDYNNIVKKYLSITRRNYTSKSSVKNILDNIKHENKVLNIKDLMGITLVCTRVKDDDKVNHYIIIYGTELKWSDDIFDLSFSIIRDMENDSFSYKQIFDKGKRYKSIINILKGNNRLYVEITYENNMYQYQVIKILGNKQYLYEFDIFELENKKFAGVAQW